eukprot:2597380-Pleurochrysis_carterae.AAC.2
MRPGPSRHAGSRGRCGGAAKAAYAMTMPERRMHVLACAVHNMACTTKRASRVVQAGVTGLRAREMVRETSLSRARARACVRAYVHARVLARGLAGARACVRACERACVPCVCKCLCVCVRMKYGIICVYVVYVRVRVRARACACVCVGAHTCLTVSEGERVSGTLCGRRTPVRLEQGFSLQRAPAARQASPFAQNGARAPSRFHLASRQSREPALRDRTRAETARRSGGRRTQPARRDAKYSKMQCEVHSKWLTSCGHAVCVLHGKVNRLRPSPRLPCAAPLAVFNAYGSMFANILLRRQTASSSSACKFIFRMHSRGRAQATTTAALTSSACEYVHNCIRAHPVALAHLLKCRSKCQ